MANSRDKIVIAVDFGTTFSGVAWTTSWQQGNVNHINRCPERLPPAFALKYPTKFPQPSDTRETDSRNGVFESLMMHQVMKSYNISNCMYLNGAPKYKDHLDIRWI